MNRVSADVAEISEEEALRMARGEFDMYGYIVFACNYPHDIGEELRLLDSYLMCIDGVPVKWYVTGASSKAEFLDHSPVVPQAWAQRLPYFYRAEPRD